MSTATTNGIMEVTVVSARGLRHTDFLGKLDPYVVLQFKNQELRSSTCRGGKPASKHRLRCCMCLRGQGTSPVWNEKFKFKVEYPTSTGGENEIYKLILKLWDQDSFTNDDYLGQSTIYVKEIFEQGVEKGKAELPTQKYRVVSEDKTYRGEIQVGVTFTTKGGTDEQERMVDGRKSKRPKTNSSSA